MLKKILNNKKGFTLVEVLVTVFVTVIIIGAATSMVLYSYKSYHSADKTTSVLNGVNSITEAVREITFNASEAEITEVTAVPAAESGTTIICCIDNAVYMDNHIIQSAKGMNISALSLTFEADNSSENGKILKYKITAADENGEQAIEPQELSAYLNNCLGDIEGTTGNCLKIKKTDVTGG